MNIREWLRQASQADELLCYIEGAVKILNDWDHMTEPERTGSILSTLYSAVYASGAIKDFTVTDGIALNRYLGGDKADKLGRPVLKEYGGSKRYVYDV